MNILILEDELTTQRLVLYLLKQRFPGSIIDTSSSIARAIELVESKAYDVVFADYYLDDGTALEIYPHLHGDIFKILMSAYHSDEINEHDKTKTNEAYFIDYGFDWYLNKTDLISFIDDGNFRKHI